MSIGALRKLQHDHLPALAARSYLQFKNLVVAGIISASDLEKKLVASTNHIAAGDALAAIRRGFQAAGRKTQ
jgi:hypothetical protein